MNKDQQVHLQTIDSLVEKINNHLDIIINDVEDTLSSFPGSRDQLNEVYSITVAKEKAMVLFDLLNGVDYDV